MFAKGLLRSLPTQTVKFTQTQQIPRLSKQIFSKFSSSFAWNSTKSQGIPRSNSTRFGKTLLLGVGFGGIMTRLPIIHAEGGDGDDIVDVDQPMQQEAALTNQDTKVDIPDSKKSIALPGAMTFGGKGKPVGGNLFQPVEYLIKMVFTGIMYAVTGILGTVTAVVLTLIGKRGLTNQTVGHFFGQSLGFLTQTHVEVVGGQEYLQQERPCVLLVNHQSGLDVFVMAYICPRDAVIMAKKTLQWIPLVGLYLTCAQTIFVSRGKQASTAKQALDESSQIMASHKFALIMFPEGTRSYSQEPKLLPFKKGAFRLAIQDQIPLVPVVVENYVHIYDAKNKLFPGGTIRVKVLPPIGTEGKTLDDMDSLIDTTYSQMQSTLTELYNTRTQ